MSYLYSPSTRGFYLPEMHGDAIPADAVAVSAEAHAALLAGQAAGQRIVPGPGGAPTLADYPPPAPPPPIRRITPLAFRRRMTPEQRGALTLAAAAAMAASPPNPALQVFIDDLSAARFVDLDDAETIGGVAAMHAAELITAEQAAALLADGAPAEAA